MLGFDLIVSIGALRKCHRYEEWAGLQEKMLSVNFSSGIVRRGLVQSLRFELAFMLLVGVTAPLSVLAFLESDWNVDGAMRFLAFPSSVNSFIAILFCAFAAIAVLRRLRLYPGVAVARSILPVVAILFGLVIAGIIGLRLAYSSKVLVVGFLGILATRFAITAMRNRSKGQIYYLVPGGDGRLIHELPSAAVIDLENPSLDGLMNYAIVADLRAQIGDQWERFLAEAAISGRPVYHYKQVWEVETGRVQIDHLSENSFGALVPSFVYQKMKRGIDLIFSFLMLPILLPVIGLCAIIVKLDSPGPAFFRQNRMGFRGRVLQVLKIRTMTRSHDGHDRNLSVTQSGDQRITRVGAFLRKTRLDELPQVFNILRGEMSWIGPRPEAVALSEWYQSEIPFYRYRHIVRPGITGWAQVNQGHVAEVDEVIEKLQYDFYYVKNLSYWLDILICIRTVRVMLSGFGAK